MKKSKHQKLNKNHQKLNKKSNLQKLNKKSKHQKLNKKTQKVEIFVEKVETPKVEQKSPKIEYPKLESPKVEQKSPVSPSKEIVDPIDEIKKEPKSAFEEKLEKLSEMGFNDRDRNIAILIEKRRRHFEHS